MVRTKQQGATTMKNLIKSSKIAFIACALMAIATAAYAEGTKAEYVDVPAGRYDLLRAHSERTMVFFGEDVKFKRYTIVDMLHQYFTVATDVKGGVRYQVQDDGTQKTLVID
jgi:hypothetical protein